MSEFIDVTQLVTGPELVLKDVPISDWVQENEAREQFSADIIALKDIAFPEPTVRVTEKMSLLGELQRHLELVIQTDLLFDYVGSNKILKQNNGNAPGEYTPTVQLST